MGLAKKNVPSSLDASGPVGRNPGFGSALSQYEAADESLVDQSVLAKEPTEPIWD